MLVQLRVKPQTDVEALATYWGQGRRSKDVRPLLQSLVRVPGGATIDIVHLLPPLPRALLYTYPLPSEKAADGTPRQFIDLVHADHNDVIETDG